MADYLLELPPRLFSHINWPVRPECGRYLFHSVVPKSMEEGAEGHYYTPVNREALGCLEKNFKTLN